MFTLEYAFSTKTTLQRFDVILNDYDTYKELLMRYLIQIYSLHPPVSQNNNWLIVGNKLAELTDSTKSVLADIQTILRYKKTADLATNNLRQQARNMISTLQLTKPM